MVDNKSLSYEKDDIILLVTDGLTNELEPKDIVEVIKHNREVLAGHSHQLNFFF